MRDRLKILYERRSSVCGPERIHAPRDILAKLARLRLVEVSRAESVSRVTYCGALRRTVT